MIVKGDRRSQSLSFVYRGLLFFLVVLGIVIIGGTIYGIVFHPVSDANKKQPVLLQKNEQNGQGQTFTGIGQIRITTSGSQPGMVILFVTFPYSPDDKAFSEELALRVRDFREIIVNYIGSFSSAELKKQNEETIKKELLHRFNTILRLGQIKTLFFSDFMIIG
ncbi:MAG: flagellar basal body-associated FliL family protein [Treponema sp.]|nr:flagellar basal body-associated FliL family protein [Treponema sp.]